MATDVEDFLAHHGVLGMHWGERKAAANAQRSQAGPTKHATAKAVILGSYGSKSRYKNAAALKKRQTAGKLRLAAISTGVGSLAISAIGGSKAREGAAALSGVLNLTTSGLALGSLIVGVQGIGLEKNAREEGR